MKLARSREPIVVTLILLIAGFFRLFRIDKVPPGMHFDEAFNIFDILRLLQGQFSIFFPANHGREPLYFYLTTVAATIFGDKALTLRLTSAVIGIATVFVVYGFARSLFRSRLVAAFAAFLMAISVWHIYYSRLGLRVVLSVPLTLLALLFFWRAISQSLDLSIYPSPIQSRLFSPAPPWSATRDYALSGLFASLTVYTYTSGRLLPVILILMTVSAIILDRVHWRSYLFGLVIAGVVAFIVFVPLGYYFMTHPSDFLEHGSYLSIWDASVNKGDLVGTFRDNLVAVAGMFLVRGDQEAFRNVPEHPVFDPLIGILFLVGLGLIFVLVARNSSPEHRLRSILILICLIAFLSVSVLSDAPPNFTRTLAAAPFAILLPAWALAAVLDRFTAARRQRIGLVAVSAVLFISSTLTFNDYFIGFASSPALYYAFDVRMFDVAEWTKANSPTNQIYLAPLWYQDGTLALLTRNMTLKSFESRDTIVLPSRGQEKDALYAFPIEQGNKAEKLAERLGPLASREDVYGSTGERILVAYRVLARDLPDPANPLAALTKVGAFAQPQNAQHAVWGNQLQMLGYSIGAADAPKRNLEVTLFVQALKPMNEDYTFSIKVRDDRDRVWGQEDKWLGDNSYATTAMSAGDLVIEKFYPGLGACAPAGDYHITLEAYDPKTMQVLALTDRTGSAVELDTTHANTAQGNLFPDLSPAQELRPATQPPFQLFGFTLEPELVSVGEEFSLSLFWGVSGEFGTIRHVSVRLQDTVLGEKDVSLPSASCGQGAGGCGICALFDLRVPASVTSGTRALFVNDFKIGTLNIK